MKGNKIMNKKSKKEQMFILLAVFAVCSVLFVIVSCGDYQEIPTGNGNSIHSCGDSSSTCLCGSVGDDKPIFYYGSSGCLVSSAFGCAENANGEYYQVCGCGCGEGCMGCIVSCSDCEDFKYGASCFGCKIGDLTIE